MEAARELARERVVTLMTPTEKLDSKSKAKDAGLSVGEFVRRSVDAFDAEEMRQLEELAILAREFRLGMERASIPIDRTNSKIEKALAELSARRDG